MKAIRFAAFFIAAFIPFAVAAAQESRPPNVVLILADDLGWGDVGFNGRKEWATPNLDRLASQGTIFRRWYTAGVTCAPSRAALMTGRYTIHCGVSANNQDLPSSEVTIAEALKARGYATALFGKWHHGRPRPGFDSYLHPMDHGFDEFFGFTNATDAHQQYPKQLWHGREQKPVDGYANILFTNRGLDFLRRHQDKPFFLYLPYTISHFRIEAPAENVAPFRGKFREKNPDEPLNATYAAMVSRLDNEVGRVLAALEELKLSDNTLVVFTSDHGATFEAGNKGTSAYHKSNGPFRGQKRTLWEGGIRVPGVVRWPGRVPAGKTSDEIVHMTDVLPTVLAAAGSQPQPATMVDGQNLLDVWRGESKSPQRTLFWEWRVEGYNQLAAMRGDLKLVVTGGTPPELYDVVADPGEMRSLHAEHPGLVKQLQDEMKAWIATEVDASKQRGPNPAGATRAGATRMEKVRVSDDGERFVFSGSGKPFVPWGFNYLGTFGELVEESWATDWPRLERDFREMRKLGANVVRVHLQLGTYMKGPGVVDQWEFGRLRRMFDLARENGLYLDVTGLGCYRLKRTPAWYDALDERGRWAAQARFWEEVAKTGWGHPAVFCYDLMNEPVVGGASKPGDPRWVTGELGGFYFVQRLTDAQGDRPAVEIAEAWVRQLTETIREHDPDTPITVGAIPWAIVWPNAKPLFYSPQVARHLDFVSIHVYPKTGEVEKAVKALAVYDVGKPLVVEETFPLSCSIDELDEFIDWTADRADGWISHYFGRTIDEHRGGAEPGGAMVAEFLEYWCDKGKVIAGKRSPD